MGTKMCHNCGENVITLTDKCPKCGIIPKESTSPVFIGIIVVAILILTVITGLLIF